MTWKDIPGYEGLYRVSDEGWVFNLTGNPPRLINVSDHAQGYKIATLRKTGKSSTYLIHRLVLLAFVGQPPDGMVVNHKNGDKTDNRLENLEYCTQMENIHHAMDVLSIQMGSYLHNNRPYGELNSAAKLTEADVRDIKRRLKTGESKRSISLDYPVSEAMIRHIAHERAWSHVHLD